MPSRLLISIIGLLCLLAVGSASAQSPTPILTPTSEPESFPPNGFYVALADVNARIGQNINLVCSNPSDAATCEMSNVLLDWEWALSAYSDAGLGCPDPGAVYAVQQTSAYTYLFTWQGVNYDYRQAAFGGTPPFLCTATGRQTLLPPGSNPAITGNSGGTAPQPIVTLVPSPSPVSSVRLDANCPLAPRLQVNSEARVTPGEANNVRAQPGLTQTFVGQIPGGQTFRVVGGPTCADGIYWWQVQYQLLLGWTGEGQNGVYWVEPILQTLPTPTEFILPSARSAITPSTATRLERATSLTGGSPLAWSSDGRLVLSSPNEARLPSQWLWVYDGRTISAQALALPIDGVLLDVAFNPANPTQLVSLSRAPNALAGEIRLWELQMGGTYRFEIIASLPNAQALALNPEGTLLAVTVGDPQAEVGANAVFEVQLYALATRTLAGRLLHDDYPSDLVFSPDGSRLASGNGAAVILWDVASQTRLAVLPTQLNTETGGLAFSPDGAWLAISSATAPDPSGNRQFYAALWEMATRTNPQSLLTQDPVTGLAFSPDGAVLALAESNPAGQTAQISLWDYSQARQLGTVEPLEVGWLRDVSFSPDSTLLIFSNRPAAGNARVEVFIVTE
jgi:hypothetical protein